MTKRKKRIDSLLKEVIAEVIMNEVRNPNIHSLITVNKVESSKDLHHAKVYVGLIGSELDKSQTLKALASAAGFVSSQAAKRVEMRYFPSLTFCLDKTVEHEIKIHTLLEEMQDERSRRIPPEELS